MTMFRNVVCVAALAGLLAGIVMAAMQTYATVPLIKKAKLNDTITTTLDGVSAKLTTDDLISMNAEAATGTNLSDIAKKWLADAGIS